LAIIIVLSVGFSLAFYQTSASQLKPPMLIDGKPPQSAQPANGLPSGIMKGAQVPVGDVAVSSSRAEKELEQLLAATRAKLRDQLLIFNALALVIGGAVSYFLADRSLRPIEAAMDAQNRFAVDASHELRTPLTIMQTELEVALRDLKLKPQRARTALEGNLTQVARLKKLCEGLLRLTQPTPNRTAFQPLRLDEITGEAVDLFMAAASAKQIKILAETPELKVYGDAQGLRQVLAILLDNAIKYSPPGSTIRVDGSLRAKELLLRVQDEGQGVPPADLPHIFERFYRSHTARSSGEGYGLGLSIAQKIVEQHGGAIAVTSKLGSGSTFTIRLPAIS
jgi:signal transduction histidine kinase